MKSVGEVMSIGRTFNQALQKALRSLENGTTGLHSPLGRDVLPDIAYSPQELERIRSEVKTPTPRRLFWVGEAYRAGIPTSEIAQLSAIDPWFLREIEELIRAEREIAGGEAVSQLRRWKRVGLFDKRNAQPSPKPEQEDARQREVRGQHRVFQLVDTCAVQFEAK